MTLIVYCLSIWRRLNPGPPAAKPTENRAVQANSLLWGNPAMRRAESAELLGSGQDF